MAPKSAPVSNAKTPKSGAQPGAKTSKAVAGRPVPVKSEPVADDHTYGLVSVLYHALQGAETYGQYAADAEEAGEDELVEFFQQCVAEENRRAVRAKKLLSAQLSTGLDDDDEEDEEDDDDDDDDE